MSKPFPYEQPLLDVKVYWTPEGKDASPQEKREQLMAWFEAVDLSEPLDFKDSNRNQE